MTAVPVVWQSYGGTQARGYWDQAFVEWLLEPGWTVPGGVTFEHVTEPDRLPDVAGGVLVVPAHGDEQRRIPAATITDSVAAWGWVLLVLTSDEENGFPWWEIVHPNMAVWKLYGDPRHPRQPDKYLPVGWTPATTHHFDGTPTPVRDLPWVWCGQITHPRRRQLSAALHRWGGGHLVETAGFAQGIPQTDMLDLYARARMVPCAAGPHTPDTFRTYEALEAGAVPVLDAVSAKGLGDGYWERVLGDDHPLPVLADWRELPDLVLPDPAQVRAWWGRRKRLWAWQLQDTLGLLSGDPFSVYRAPIPERITVLVTTSPIHSHPDTGIIDQTIDSIRAQLPTAEIVVAADGVRPELAHYQDRYAEYLDRLTWKALHHWSNVVVHVGAEWKHQAATVAEALPLVRTPLLLFVEHDTPIEGFIDWASIGAVVAGGEFNAVRLHPDVSIFPGHEYLMAGEWEDSTGLHIMRTRQWSQRPHVARTEWYRDLLSSVGDSKTMIEDRIYGTVEGGTWGEWRVGIYRPKGSIKRSGHLDGRGPDSKYEELFT